MTTSANGPDYGRYELLAKIGEGLRGPAFVARIRGEPSADPLYVVELNAFATGEDEAQRAFQHDIARAARVRHKNVLSVLEIGESSAGHFVAMDYVEGCTLAELQDRHRAIRPPRLVVTTVIDALHGLHAAHGLRTEGVLQPLVHGGLSPDQLLLGTDGTCRVTGFGNVRPRIQTKPSHRTRTAIGYMAPEQLTGAEVDHRADLFAIGVVLWNALTGRKLFHDRVEHETMSNVLDREVPRPSSIGLAPPPLLDAFVLKALERSPARRFQDASEMAGALRDVARQAACLAAGSEISEWITTTFGSELAARRRTLRELAQRPRRASSEISALAPLGSAQAPESSARDELSREELARAATGPVVRATTGSVPRIATGPVPRAATGPVPRAATGPLPRAGSNLTAPTITLATIQAPAASAVPDPAARKRLVIVGVAAFAVVALVIGWRASSTASGPSALVATPEAAAARAVGDPPPEFEVTVLDVRTVAAAEPVAPSLPTPLVRPPPATTAPSRPAPSKPSRPRSNPRPAEVRAAPAVKPAETRGTTAPPPGKPDPQRPTLESNPYLYK